MKCKIELPFMLSLGEVQLRKKFGAASWAMESKVIRFLVWIPFLIGFFALASCGQSEEEKTISYDLQLTAEQIGEFKSDIENFASEAGHTFVDGSLERENARRITNEEHKRVTGAELDLVNDSGQIIDIAIEPVDHRSNFIIFSKTSPDSINYVNLTIIYRDESEKEKMMFEQFRNSKFYEKWLQ